MTKPETDEEVYNMYAGIAVCLAVLYIIYCQVTSKKPEFDGQLTMADVVKDKSTG